MTFLCHFDNGNCALNCTETGCSQTKADGVCDSNCNSSICGFDFGDCAYCLPDCTSTLYYNSVCDNVCNYPVCNYDNFHCVSYK